MQRNKRARDAAELAGQYENSERFQNSADLLNQIQQLQMQVEELKNRQIPQTSSEIDPNIAAVLNTSMEYHKQLLERQINPPNVIQIASTNDTANSIQIFHGNIMDKASEWIKEVDRIWTTSKLANELKLTNAISRLAGSATNWQITQGYHYNEWKSALSSRFKRRKNF
ncbi:hypothetical protein AVEN_244520-1 [Araneus ventricosus]|uniref:Uncharacterized protein n=1 Tax=Araneus ventricosus TaxID=182803 RepID=A0A4Y2F2K2_ARAVE|nr:hypothetical protein AVEN_244520-1 [Araneus ventricosus]